MHRVVMRLLLPLFISAAPLAAQTDETGLLEGLVVDQSGATLLGAVVDVAMPDGAFPRQQTTSQDGSFRVGFLKPGFYDVRVRTIGYRPVVHTGVRIRAGQVTRLTVTQEAAPVQLDPVTVEATAPLVDRTTQEFIAVLGTEEIRRLPIPRATTELIQYFPGARPDQIWGGSTQQANIYQIDGVNVNNPGPGGDFLLPNVDWVADFSVRGLGAGAEYGGFQGGLVNIVTRSGSNTFEPRLRFYYQATSLNASQATNTFESGREQDKRWEFNADVGGPIVRDKLYYYFSGQFVRNDFRVLDASSTLDDLVYITDPMGNTVFERTDETKLLGKLTWQASGQDVVNGVFGYDGLFGDNRGLNSFDDPQTTQNQESPAVFYNASWQRTWSGNHLTQFKVTGYNGRDDRIPQNGAMQQVQRLDGNLEAFRNARSVNTNKPDNLSFNADWDSYWNTGTVRHHLKVGGQVTFGWWDEREIRTGQLSWRPEEAPGVTFDPNDPSSWGFISSDWGADINLVARSTNASLFVQDYVSISPRLSLSGGLRLNHFRGHLTPDGGSGARFRAMDDVKVAPRIGATFTVLEDQGLVAKAHWGRYYQNLFALMFDRTIGANVFTDLEFWDWVDPGLPVLDQTYTEAERDQLFDLFQAIPLGEEVGPVEGWSQPYVDQFVGGLEWEFAENWKAGAVYVNRRNRDIISLVDRNQATNYTEVNGVSVVDKASGDPVLDQNGNALVLPSVFLSNDDIVAFDQDVGGFFPSELDALGLTAADVAGLTYDQDLVLTSSDATRDMDQVQVTVERAFRTWSLLTAVVWTDLRGDFFTVNGYDDPVGSGAGPFVRPNEGLNFFGKMPNYSEWEFMVRAVGDLPANFRAGGFLTLSAGDFYTPVYVIDTRQNDFVGSNGTLLESALFGSVAGDRMFLEQRGSRTLDQLFRFDLHVDWTLRLRGVDWLFALDVFNVFNSGAVTVVKNEVNNQDPSDATTLFGATRFFQNPRNIRLGASLGF